MPIGDVSLYEPKEEALEMLREAQFRITQAVEAFDDPAWMNSSPLKRIGTYFPPFVTR
jgi:hypothetical protein